MDAAMAPKIANLLWFLVPSYFQGPDARAKLRPTKISPTTYLDGLRGLCALIVVFYHLSYKPFEANMGYGANGKNYDFWKLPIVRLLYQGSPGVSIFFVISGYVLSYRPVSHARNRDFESAFNSLSSMTFRRFFRLYLPTTIATFITAFLARIGVYELTKHYNTVHSVVVERHPLHFNTTIGQFKHWINATFELVEVYKWNPMKGSPYDVHLWTIPVEFRCSLYLFLVVMGTARLHSKFRFIIVSLLVVHANVTSHWEVMLFLCGMMLAEYDILRGVHLSGFDHESTLVSRPKLKKAFWIAATISSLYVMSYPDMEGPNTPHYDMLTAMVPSWWTEPKSRFWQPIGAVILMTTVSHMPSYQRLFNTRVIFYLGKISYALYIIHGPIIHSLGYMIEERALRFAGKGHTQYVMGWMLGSCFTLPIVLWAADVFWRVVDIPSVKFARWLETELMPRADQKQSGLYLG